MAAVLVTADAKVRMFDRLIATEPHLSAALRLLARERARALITIHESGLKPGGRSFGQADFGLPEISSALEIVSGSALDIDALVHEERLKVEGHLAGADQVDAE